MERMSKNKETLKSTETQNIVDDKFINIDKGT